MATRNGPYNDGSALRVRVDTLAEDLRGFHAELRDVRSSMATRADMEALGKQISTIAAKQDSSARPNWQMWSVAVAVLGLIGAVLYWPINRDTSRLDIAVASILDKGVFEKQYLTDKGNITDTLKEMRSEWNQNVLRETYLAGLARQNEINKTIVTRDEHTQEEQQRAVIRKILEDKIDGVAARQSRDENKYLPNSDFTAQHNDLKNFLGVQVENLQRQITGVQSRLNETWSARDALIDLRQRLERVERGPGQ
jgi:hypothetical protein